MKTCPICGSTEIYHQENGVVEGEHYVYIRKLKMLSVQTPRETYVCTKCGYYVNFIKKENLLMEIRNKWEKS